MSDDAYTPPANDESVFDSVVLTGAVKTISVICVVFGALGLLQGLMGIGALVGQSAIQELSMTSVPPGAQDEARLMFEATAQLMPFTAGFILLGLAISAMLIYGGVKALTSKKTQVLQIITGATAAYIVVAELGFSLFFNNWWIAESKAVYMDAILANTPGAGAAVGDMMALGTVGGLVIGALFILVRVAFYVWAFVTVKSFSSQSQ